MSTPVTTVLHVYKKDEYDPAHIIVRFKGHEYRVQKNFDGPGLIVYTNRGRGYYLLKSRVGEGAFADMLKKVDGIRLPPGWRQH